LQVFTGPFLPNADFERLRRAAGDRASVVRFTPDFLSYLAAADLSVSMAGYNTTMNLLAARVPALVWPFSQNREQRLRCQRLEALGALRILQNGDLDAPRLAGLMGRLLEHAERPDAGLDLNGAQATARWVDAWRPPETQGEIA
jgi:predicted glycosyltransferase